MGVAVIHASKTAAMGQQQGRFSADSATRSTLANAARIAMCAFAVTLTACGGRLEPPTATSADADTDSAASMAQDPSPDTPQPTLNAALRVPAHDETSVTAGQGVLLAGVPGTNAYSALRGHVEETAHAAASPSQRLSAVIDRSATVGQVNAALTAADARIVSMQPGNPEVMLDLAQPAQGIDARNAVAQLLATRAFTSIHIPGSAPAPVSAPGGSVHAQVFDPSAPEPVEDHTSPP